MKEGEKKKCHQEKVDRQKMTQGISSIELGYQMKSQKNLNFAVKKQV